MKILIACEFSGIVRDAFRARGHDAYSCDILESEADNSFHIIGDVIKLLKDNYDLMIAHPPCTFLCNSGVSHLYTDASRWQKMQTGALFFRELLEANIPKIAIENPIMHKFAVDIIGRRQDQIIQPFYFGHLESKATCLWLKNLPKLIPTNNVKNDMMKLAPNIRQRIHYLPPSTNRSKERSRTFTGIAKAMSEQWG